MKSNTNSTSSQNYNFITSEDKIFDIISHPAFKGFGFHIFPWNSKDRYSKTMKMKEAPSLNLWHTNLNIDEEVRGINRLITDINKGYKVFYDIYTEEEKKKTHLKNIQDSFI